MSGFSTPRDGAASAQPKQISNRLLNMKFMQRAAASATQKPGDSPSTPTGQPVSKRRRTGDYISTSSGPNTPLNALTPTYSDRTAISGALSAEAQSTSISSRIHNLGLEGDETEWVLNIEFPVTNGNAHSVTTTATNGTIQDDGEDDYSSEEDREDDIWSPSNPIGRQTYGSFNRKKKTKPTSIDPTTEGGERSARKRIKEDLDDGEISSGSGSSSDSDVNSGSMDSSEDGSKSATKAQSAKKQGTFNFKSEADLKKMDTLDFQKKGFEHGLGRQRAGLSGGGGGGGSAIALKRPGHTTTKSRPKKKTRKSR